jgi:hypothetical protein
MLPAPAAPQAHVEEVVNSPDSQSGDCGFNSRREYVERLCLKFCSHGGMCTITTEHTIHGASGYCTFTDEEAITKVEADAIGYTMGNGAIVDLQNIVEAMLGIEYDG